MERATRSTDRTPHTTAPPPSAPIAKGADIERVGKNAAASAVALGSCFGTMTALNNAVRATPGMPRSVKIFTGCLPSLGVYPTPWVEDGVRNALGTTATFPVKPSLAHDGVAAASLFLFNLACSRSPSIPKFPAATRAGMAATVVQATLASVFAGGASELTAQWMNQRDQPEGAQAGTPPHLDDHRKATGRLLSQVPAVALQTALAVRSTPLPASLSLLPLATVTGGWSLRRVLIPPAPTTNALQTNEPKSSC